MEMNFQGTVNAAWSDIYNDFEYGRAEVFNPGERVQTWNATPEVAKRMAKETFPFKAEIHVEFYGGKKVQCRISDYKLIR